MSRKKGKANKSKGNIRKGVSNTKAGLVALVSDKKVLQGAAIGAGGALLVDTAYSFIGPKLPEAAQNPFVKIGLSSIAPAVVASFISKDRDVVKTAAAVGIAGGIIALVGEQVRKMFTPAAVPNQNATKGMIEDVYSQVNGDYIEGDYIEGVDELGRRICRRVRKRPAPVQVEAQSAPIEGLYDEVQGEYDEVQGEYDEVQGSLQGDDDIVSGFGLAGGMYDDTGVSGEDDSIIN